jgi:hypothetical protein
LILATAAATISVLTWKKSTPPSESFEQELILKLVSGLLPQERPATASPDLTSGYSWDAEDLVPLAERLDEQERERWLVLQADQARAEMEEEAEPLA